MQEMQKTHVQSLGWEDPLEKGTATHSGILAWKIPWTVAHRAPLSMGSQRVGRDLVTEQACQGRRDEGGARQGWKERRGEREVWRHYVRSYIHSGLFLAFPPAL